jgi:5-methylcytosine-specific restriction protein A
MPTAPPNHRRQAKRPVDNRPNSTDRGYNYRWKQLRARHLGREPLCVHCRDKGKTVMASEVDHIIPHKGDAKLFWDETNWQSLCKSCHSRKTRWEMRWGV